MEILGLRLINYQMIQARHQNVRFAWNSRALQFELRVISQCRFLSDQYRAPVEEKQTEGIQVKYLSLYRILIVQFLVVSQFSKELNISSNCHKYLLVKLVQKPKITMQV